MKERKINLNNLNASKVNDIRVSTGGVNRNNNRLGILSSVRDRVSSFISDFGKGNKEKFKEQGQIKENVISAYKPVEHYELPKKTTWQKITSLLERKLIECLNSKKIM